MPDRWKVALAFTDAFLAAGGPLDSDVRAAAEQEFSAEELVELGIGLALFHGVSKLLVTLGCEPEQMDVTALPPPGS